MDIIQGGVFDGYPKNHFKVILIDSPWSFKPYSMKNIEKMPDAHYTCMDLNWIKSLPLQDLAAEDCVCISWCTAPMIREGLASLEAWGFKFSTMGAWAKQSSTGAKWGFGTGYVYRSAMEPWILGTRGKPKSKSRSIRNLIVAPIRQHSRKPDQMRENIEAQFDGPFIELFAREPAPGWSAWGNQISLFEGK